MSVTNSLLLLLATHLPQDPEPAPPRARALAETVGPRALLERAFRGKGARPARLEFDGRIVDFAELEREIGDEGPFELEGRHRLILEVLEKELRARDLLPDEAETGRRFAEYRQPYDSTPFSTEVIATRFKGYPSLASFARRWRLADAYSASIRAEIDDAALRAELARNEAWLGDAKVSVELWYHGAQRDDGWDYAAARERAAATRARLDEGGEPATDASLDSFTAFAGQSFNQLRGRMRETEYTDLLHDGSAARLLFAGAAGEWLGPLRGTDGYWVARVTGREGGRPVAKEAMDERRRELVRQIHVERRFQEWATEVLGRAVVRLPQQR